MSEKEKADKVVTSSYLIAEGNKLAESDISKAMMCYVYGIDSNLTTFRLIDSFYKQNVQPGTNIRLASSSTIKNG